MSFTLDLQRAAKNINANTEKVIRGTVLGLSKNIIKGTPVGNPDLWESSPPPGYVGGSLRAAWQASIGRPDVSTTTEIDPNGRGTVAKAKNIAMTLEVGQVYYLTNPLPYAYAVEYGWSSQAPKGMVRKNVMQAQQVINSL